MSKFNPEGALLFEQPFARVPYENYRKVFRASQKAIDKELGTVQSSCTEMSKRSASGAQSSEDAVKSIEAMMTRVENLKRKLNEIKDTSGTPTQSVIRHRLEHLAVLETSSSADPNQYERWSNTRLDRWLVDWALRNGLESTARHIARDKDIETLVDINLFTDIRRIEKALSMHSCSEALAWCNENKAALRKIKNTLEFDLRLQEYIELTRQRKTQEAISYSKKHFGQWQDTHLPQMQTAFALLAFPPTTTCVPYKRLYNRSRWNTLISGFRSAVYTLNTLPSSPLLYHALYAGLASLKLPACYHQAASDDDVSVDDHVRKNPDCPVCDADLGKLAEEVPFSHHANSTIVCRITGKIMEGDNMPLAFPDGHVYSREALEDMAVRNNGVVTCPRTGVTCQFSELKKVFIS